MKVMTVNRDVGLDFAVITFTAITHSDGLDMGNARSASKIYPKGSGLNSQNELQAFEQMNLLKTNKQHVS